jgi:hypothetical protein
MKLKSWVETVLFVWAGIDIGLVLLALYMERLLELGL